MARGPDRPSSALLLLGLLALLRVRARRCRGARLARTLALVVATTALGSAGPALAQRFDFQLERYEPTPTGSWTFAVDRPGYSTSHPWVAGLTLDYGHRPLVMGRVQADGSFIADTAVVSHQMVGRLEVAGSIAGRLLLAGFLPVTLLERGTAVEQVAPLSGMAAGDPRLTAYLRILGHGHKDRWSLHAAADLWIPIDAESRHAGDTGLRLRPKLVMAGLLTRHITHSASLAMLFRPTGEVSSDTINAAAKIGHEVHAGAAVGWTDLERTWHAGLEMTLATTVAHAELFHQDSTAFEVLVGGQHTLRRDLLLGAAVGSGILREPGTSDLRVILRLAYAPSPWSDPEPP